MWDVLERGYTVILIMYIIQRISRTFFVKQNWTFIDINLEKNTWKLAKKDIFIQMFPDFSLEAGMFLYFHQNEPQLRS